MKGKRVCIYVVVMACLFGAAEGATRQLPFSLVVREQFGSIAVGDLNTTLLSINSGYDLIRSSYPPWGCVGEIQAISGRFTDWEAEFQWEFWWGFSIGIAVSAPTRYGGSSFLTFSIMNDGLNETENNTYEPNIKVSPPLMLNLYKSFDLLRNICVAINGGIGLYRAQMTQNQLYQVRYPLEEQSLTTFYWDVQGRQLGYHLGIALEYRFSRRFSMTTEGQWRFAKISTLQGSAITETQMFDAAGNLTNTATSSTDGILYHYFGQDFSTGQIREKLLVEDLDPPWVGIDLPTDIREAFLDLGGFSLKIGLRIRLF